MLRYRLGQMLLQYPVQNCHGRILRILVKRKFIKRERWIRDYFIQKLCLDFALGATYTQDTIKQLYWWFTLNSLHRSSMMTSCRYVSYFTIDVEECVERSLGKGSDHDLYLRLQTTSSGRQVQSQINVQKILGLNLVSGMGVY